MIAILRDDFECVRFIVRDHHQTLNDQRENGDTALILATKKGNIQIIKEIMKYQPNIFLTNEVPSLHPLTLPFFPLPAPLFYLEW